MIILFYISITVQRLHVPQQMTENFGIAGDNRSNLWFQLSRKLPLLNKAVFVSEVTKFEIYSTLQYVTL